MEGKRQSTVGNISNDTLTIDANPTKEFFIDMLTKDIPLIRAILDLVDNSLDGARRMRGDSDYNGLNVNIDYSDNNFRISDNCGGITVDTARRYAFRFGRSERVDELKHSVGRFGVGMKRALFKMGKDFNILSICEYSRFRIIINIDVWKNKDKWEFQFDELKENISRIPSDQWGTSIVITSLYDEVAEKFRLVNFNNDLRIALESAHQYAMDQGLEIVVNRVPLRFRPAELLQSNDIKPAYWETTYTQNDKAPITVKIYTGISKSDPKSAGWYIYCNGRMILDADKTIDTGWGEGNEKKIPRYHNQYSMFRGYLFFESDDASLLPWNTTKTGVDTDSSLYRTIRLEMLTFMRPVIDFINDWDKEKDSAEITGHKPLDIAVASASVKRLSAVNTAESFIRPRSAPQPRLPQTQRIQYDRPIEEIEKLKNHLGVRSNKEVGEKTFEYYLESECYE